MYGFRTKGVKYVLEPQTVRTSAWESLKKLNAQKSQNWRSSLAAQWVKDLMLSLLWSRLLLWQGFNPWPFCMLWAWSKKKKKSPNHKKLYNDGHRGPINHPSHRESQNPGFFFFFFFLVFCLFRAAPMAYGGSQARGPIGAVAASLHHSHAGSEPCLQPTPQLTAMPDP